MKDYIAKAREWLKGKKTYIGLFCLFVLSCLAVAGIVDPTSPTFDVIAVAIATLTGAAFRAGMNQ